MGSCCTAGHRHFVFDGLWNPKLNALNPTLNAVTAWPADDRQPFARPRVDETFASSKIACFGSKTGTGRARARGLLINIDRKRSWFQGSIELNYCVARSITLDVHLFLSL